MVETMSNLVQYFKGFYTVEMHVAIGVRVAFGVRAVDMLTIYVRRMLTVSANEVSPIKIAGREFAGNGERMCPYIGTFLRICLYTSSFCTGTF